MTTVRTHTSQTIVECNEANAGTLFKFHELRNAKVGWYNDKRLFLTKTMFDKEASIEDVLFSLNSISVTIWCTLTITGEILGSRFMPDQGAACLKEYVVEYVYLAQLAYERICCEWDGRGATDKDLEVLSRLTASVDNVCKEFLDYPLTLSECHDLLTK